MNTITRNLPAPDSMWASLTDAQLGDQRSNLVLNRNDKLALDTIARIDAEFAARAKASGMEDALRLILMDQPDIHIATMRRSLQDECYEVGVHQLRALWIKYVGWQGDAPTHNIETGERVR